jgi:putative oxidoreductase
MNYMKLLNRNIDLGILIIRLSVGVLMLLHGISKLIHGVGFIEDQVVAAGLPVFVAYGVYVGEVIAPIFIIAGFGTRIASGVFAINCLVAALLVHAADIFTLNPQGGWMMELLGLFFFGAVALVFTGGGKYALSNKYLWD